MNKRIKFELGLCTAAGMLAALTGCTPQTITPESPVRITPNKDQPVNVYDDLNYGASKASVECTIEPGHTGRAIGSEPLFNGFQEETILRVDLPCKGFVFAHDTKVVEPDRR